MAAHALGALADYNAWATTRVLQLVDAIPDEHRHDEAPGTAGSIALTIAHAAEVERYFARLVDGGTAANSISAADWSALRSLALLAVEELASTAATLDEPGRLVARGRRTYAAEDLLLQALTHSLQHRTQVLAALAQRSVATPPIDFIDWLESRDARRVHPRRSAGTG